MKFNNLIKKLYSLKKLKISGKSGFILPIIAIVSAFAEPTPTPTPESPQMLPETVVTGVTQSLTNPPIQALREQIAEIPGAGEVIDAETYKGGRSTTLKDALDYAPGVFVQPRFGAE